MPKSTPASMFGGVSFLVAKAALMSSSVKNALDPSRRTGASALISSSASASTISAYATDHGRQASGSLLRTWSDTRQYARS
jgi:hypothetical protein